MGIFFDGDFFGQQKTFSLKKKCVCVFFFCAVFGGVFLGRFKGISSLWWVGGFVCDEKIPEVKKAWREDDLFKLY